jgi:NADH-quinone oxidoreductase subunit C
MPDETTPNGTPPVSPQPAATPSAGDKAPASAAPPAAKPTPLAKPAGPVPEPWDSEMTRILKRTYGSGMVEASTYLGQDYLVVELSLLTEILQLLRDDESFDYLVDLTAVHYPQRTGAEFEVVYILYSFAKNVRMRVKAQVADGAAVPSAVEIWPTANWLERECFDMFGIRFAGHPDLKRILLPDGWKGYPLRKEYGIIQQDDEWVQINLGIESGQ